MKKMTKTFKLSVIFFITVVVFLLLRILAQYLPLSDHWLSWIFSFLNQIINLVVLPIVLYKLFVSKDKKDFTKDFRLNPKVPAKIWGLTAAVAILMYFVTIGVAVLSNLVLQMLGYTFANSVGTIYSSPIVLVMEILTGAMFPAFAEEFADRGLLLAVLDGEKNDNKKILLMAVMFGLLHQNIMQFGYAIFGGFVLAYLAIKTRSLFPGMIVHFFNNFMSTMVDYSSQKGGLLGGLYDRFFDFVNNNIILAFVVWGIAAAALIYVLRTIGKLSVKDEPNVVFTEIVSEPNEIQSLFGISPEPQTVRAELPEEKVKRREYAFLYASIVMTALTTLFTLIWGLIR